MFSELISHITNFDHFLASLQGYIENLSINSVILTVMMIFMVVGAVDKIRGNKLGYGEKFDDGFNSMGSLCFAMVGIVTMTPILRMVLQPLIGPVYEFLGASPAMFATTLLACDMGGYPLAMELAGEDVAVGNFAGLMLGSMMGATIVFSIPVGLSIVEEKDRPFLASGILCGLVTIPIGCLVGGLFMNLTEYKINFMSIILNLVPVIIIAGLIAVGLWFKPMAMMNGFAKFGNAVTVMITIAITIAVFQQNTGIMLPLFDTMVEIDPETGTNQLFYGVLTIGSIVFVLIGAFPMVHFITSVFKKPLMKFGKIFGMNENSSAGMVATLANNIAMFDMMKTMDDKGKILNVAFAVSAAFVFGDHLGFVAGVNSEMIFPVTIGKLVAGVTALILANILSSKLLAKINVQLAVETCTED